MAGRDRVLLIEAVVSLLVVGLALRFAGLARLRAWAGSPGDRKAPLDRLVWAIHAASRVLPGVTCLSSALALQRMLSLRGYGGKYRLPRSSSPPTRGWREGRVLIGEQDHGDYAPRDRLHLRDPDDRRRVMFIAVFNEDNRRSTFARGGGMPRTPGRWARQVGGLFRGNTLRLGAKVEKCASMDWANASGCGARPSRRPPRTSRALRTDRERRGADPGRALPACLRCLGRSLPKDSPAISRCAWDEERQR